MQVNQFKKEAMESISSDPMTRVPDPMKLFVVDSDRFSLDKLFIDVHSHCFTYDNVPSGFPGMGIRLPDFALNAIGSTAKWIGAIFSLLTFRERVFWSSYSKQRFLKRFSKEKEAHDIYMHQLNRYKKAFREMYKAEPWIIMVQLMMDMERGIKGKVKQGFYEQIVAMDNFRHELENIKGVLPFLAVDPANPNLLEDFLAVFSSLNDKRTGAHTENLQSLFPFFGVKLYPSLGYFPSDPVLMPIYEICEEKNIPITSHCGGATTHYNKTKYLERKRLIIDAAGKSKEENYRINMRPLLKKKAKIAKTFNAPDNWIPVLHKFPKLKLNIAHFGSDNEWEAYRNGKANTHIHQTLDLLDKLALL